MYEKLKTVETAKEVPEEVKQRFEEALRKAWCHYLDTSFSVDNMEADSPTELAELVFAKGFLAGCAYVLNELI